MVGLGSSIADSTSRELEFLMSRDGIATIFNQNSDLSLKIQKRFQLFVESFYR